jgi:hypothetical protein
MCSSFFRGVAIIFLLLSQQSAYGLFIQPEENNSPIFKDKKNGIIYFTGSAGFMVFGQMGSYRILGFDKDSFGNGLTNLDIKSSLRTKYNTYFNAGIGYTEKDSIFRHEIEFSYFQFAASPSSYINASYNQGNTNYITFDNRKITSLGGYTRMIRAMYSFYITYPKIFSLNSVDSFAFLSCGLAMLKGGLYVKSQQNPNDSQVKENSIKSYSDAIDNKLITGDTSFAVSYEAGIGFVYNINSTFAAQVKIKYGAVTRPLFDIKLSPVAKVSGSHLLNFVGIDLGMLFRAI